jgi:hypothetical protein
MIRVNLGVYDITQCCVIFILFHLVAIAPHLLQLSFTFFSTLSLENALLVFFNLMLLYLLSLYLRFSLIMSYNQLGFSL